MEPKVSLPSSEKSATGP